MPWYRIDAAQVRDVTTGELHHELVGQQVTIVARDTDTPFPIFDSVRDPIPDSRVSVSSLFTVPSVYINVDEPADLYLDWLDADGVRGPVEFEAVLRDAARAAAAAAAESRTAATTSQEAAEAARSFAAAAIRTIGGEPPDETGDWTGTIGPGGDVTKESLGLGSVDNTRDEDKPVSTKQQAAIDEKADDDAVVKLTGEQDISGIKKFADRPVVPDASFPPSKVEGLVTALAGRVLAPAGGLTVAEPMSKAAYNALPTKDPRTIYFTWGG